jgi:hypothetical protein
MRHILFRPRPPRTIASVAAAFIASVGFSGVASAEFAGSVQSYTQGTVTFSTSAQHYDTPTTALGQPSRIAGLSDGFAGPVTPFAGPYEQSELVAVGVGGSITLELSSPVQTGGPVHVGIFSAVTYKDPTFSGQALSPALTLAGAEYGADRTAVIEVAQTLGAFRTIGRVTLANPTQGFSNQSTPYDFPIPPADSDFDKPFAGDLSSFDGLTSGQMTAMLAGSAGGNWIDLPPLIASELDEIRYVRISDPRWRVISDGSLVLQRQSNGDPLGTGQPFFKSADVLLDGVNVVVPEPASTALMGLVALCGLSRRARSDREGV